MLHQQYIKYYVQKTYKNVANFEVLDAHTNKKTRIGDMTWQNFLKKIK